MDETVLEQPLKSALLNDPVPASLASSDTNDSTPAQSSAFAFPSHPSANPGVLDTNSLGTHPSDGGHSTSSQPAKGLHKRSRTSVNKLPAFTFNPGASADPHNAAAAPASPLPDSPPPPESPMRGGRHRRSTSELVGGQGGLKSSIFPPMKVDFGALAEDVLVDSDRFPAPRGHGQRLSETRAAQHVPFSMQPRPPTLAQHSSVITSDEPPPQPSQAGDRAIDDSARDSTPLASASQADSQTRVGFADNIEVIPRPLSEASDESDASAATLKEALLSEAGSSPDATGLPTTSSSNLDAQEAFAMQGNQEKATEDGYIIHSFSDSPYTNAPDAQHVPLDENFDGDPTSAVVLGEGTEQTAFSAEKSFPPGDKRKQVTKDEPEYEAIDLDLALADMDPIQDVRSSQIRSFQSARRSMHSSAATSGFLGPGGHFHRRAESAPLLAAINFDGSASGKGFEIQDVFEEDEEDAAPGEAQQQASSKLGAHEESVEGLGIESGSKPGDAPLPPPSVAPVKSFGNRPIRRNGRTDEEQALTLPQAPFMSPDTASSSSFSSPKGQGSSDPSIQFRQSVDDVPSLMSSASTVGSGAPSNYAAGSSGSPAPGSSSSKADMKNPERRRKRASVVSLSRLIGGSYAASEKRLADADYDKRCQSSDGLALARTTKTQRLSRLLKFWKIRDAEWR